MTSTVDASVKPPTQFASPLPYSTIPPHFLPFLQKITPDVQTGCISCCSGDGKFGGPIWWNTPMEDDEAEEEKAAGNRSTWAAGGTSEDPPAPSRKRAVEDGEDEINDEVNSPVWGLIRRC